MTFHSAVILCEMQKVDWNQTNGFEWKFCESEQRKEEEKGDIKRIYIDRKIRRFSNGNDTKQCERHIQIRLRKKREASERERKKPFTEILPREASDLNMRKKNTEFL